MKKFAVLLPNGITMSNVACGFASILASIQGDFGIAAWAILFAGIFDLFDGRIARLLGASSPFGAELDTLSDMLSFGLAPALLFHRMSLEAFGFAGAIVAFAYLAAVMLRLARFTVSKGKFGPGFFQGLSSPVSAATAAAFVLFADAIALDSGARGNATLALLPLLSFLMLSGLRFPSFKGTHWRSPIGIALLAALALLLALTLANPALHLFPILAGFLVVVLGCDLAYRVRGTGGTARAALLAGALFTAALVPEAGATSPFAAKSVRGILFPETLTLDKAILRLNGVGLRQKSIFNVDVYLAALYLKSPSQDFEGVIQSDEEKIVDIVFLRAVEAADIVDSWVEGFGKYCQPKCDALRPSLARLNSLMTDVKDREKITISFLKDRFLIRTSVGPAEHLLEGKEFARVILATFIGKDPPTISLREGMMGVPGKNLASAP